MRTTLTLDPDVATRLNSEAARTDRSFKSVVNDALRRGLQSRARPAARPAYAVKPLHLAFLPGIDPDKLNDLADELENRALAKKMRQ
ncbi:MAG: hypothetical protein WC378_11475 [Opitutaceae bacterium]|jgi:hypothetical protein